ncbi:MAG: penicillin acylase family protein [Thiohalocapsa sp.]|uniref:penicillin acylase family protein n=1 Tax=Thiohalocapsa sp. TaxID=2497641 RepID=UPI0025CF5CED|nr:penicillin acylase family protein [Thiohalocapsa sp.]MCG6941983.1 penicillin acylase family protein [Thiohalocapsa sp.]
MLRWLLIALIALALLAAAAAGGVVWLGKRAEPSYQGEIALAGLAAPVSLRFSPHAVPTIEAASLDDVLFAQGYIIAAERMWQMDMLRRLAGGRLAEVLGAGALPADRFYRTMGLPLAAREALAALEPEYRRQLERYAAGVNAYLRHAAGRLPLEYRIAGFQPAPWRPEDSLVIGEYMAWINSVNLREELTFLRLAVRFGNARALELFPVDVGVPAPAELRQLPDYRELARARAPAAAAPLAASGARRIVPVLAGGASNAWAVNGPSVAGGAAMLANDPHLSPSAPAIWYELELIAPGLHVAGLALPGVPLVLLGHNEDLAWGMTTVTADTQDIFVERLNDAGDAALRADGRWEPVSTRTEQIAVKGAKARTLTISSTSHGVLIDGVIGPDNPEGLPTVRVGDALALRRNLDVPGRAVVALWRLDTATTIAAARAAGEDLRHVSENLLIAHRDGSIGWQVTGTLPRRGRGSGMLPAPGWEAGYGWVGWQPFANNPGVTNPPDGRLVSANNRSLPLEQADAVGHSWIAPYRAERILELLDDASALTAADLAHMQADRDSIRARVFMASLRRVLPELKVLEPAAARAAERDLLHWSGDFPPDSHAGALFGLLVPALYQALYGDELGEDLPALMMLDADTYGPMDEALRSGHSSFWDDIRTPTVQEGPAEVWRAALLAARSRLNDLMPKGPQRLDRLRAVTFRHAFAGQPWVGKWFSVGPIGIGGDTATVNVANASLLAPRRIGYIPSMRAVYTPADWSRTRGTITLGQSGHRFSRFRTDQLEDWLAADTHPWPWNGPAPGTGIGELRLLPAASD